MAVKWLDEPEEHDCAAAADHFSLIADPHSVQETVTALRLGKPVYRKAKDILRAARLTMLPESNTHVRSDVAKIAAGKKLSPILLVRGASTSGTPLEIAEGYHRACASYSTDENTDIPCRLVSW